MITTDKRLPIEVLVAEQMAKRGLTPHRLVQLCNYKNTNKGQKRLLDLCCGHFDEAAQIIQTLPAALDVSESAVSQAVMESRRIIDSRAGAAKAQEDIDWRTSFVPHAVVVAERQVPSPIFVAGFIGLKRLLIIEFDQRRDEATFPAQAKAGVDTKLNEWGRDGVPAIALPAFGRPVGFTVNYTPDRAVKYDLDLQPVEKLSHAYRIGDVELRIVNSTKLSLT